MRYYKQIKDGRLQCIGTVPVGAEITETEYNGLWGEIREKADLAQKLYGGEITTQEIPEAYREEIEQRVLERRAAEVLTPATQEDLLDALAVLGVSI